MLLLEDMERLFCLVLFFAYCCFLFVSKDWRLVLIRLYCSLTAWSCPIPAMLVIYLKNILIVIFSGSYYCWAIIILGRSWSSSTIISGPSRNESQVFAFGLGSIIRPLFVDFENIWAYFSFISSIKLMNSNWSSRLSIDLMKPIFFSISSICSVFSPIFSFFYKTHSLSFFNLIPAISGKSPCVCFVPKLSNSSAYFLSILSFNICNAICQNSLRNGFWRISLLLLFIILYDEIDELSLAFLSGEKAGGALWFLI